MSFAYLPLFTGDYIRDTRHLTPLRHGVFLLALIHCWDSKGPMPLDEQECAGICNCRSADEVAAMRYVLSRFFVEMDDGHYNKRMAEEVAKAERLSAAFSEAGLKGAEVRRAKARDGARTKAEGRLNLGSTYLKPRSVSPSPSPSPSLSPNQNPSPSAKISGADAPSPPSGDVSPGFSAFWTAWPKHPRKGAKAECAKLWRKNHFEPIAKTIVEHVTTMTKTEGWTKQHGEFVPAPLVYLRGKRWDGAEINGTSDSVFSGFSPP